VSKLTKTEEKILESIRDDGYCCVAHGYSDSPSGKSFGKRRKVAMNKLLTLGTIVIVNTSKYTDNVYARFGSSIAGTLHTTEHKLKLASNEAN
jgi:hypothetical protein